MRELTEQELDQIAGGNGAPLVIAVTAGYAIGTVLNETFGISDAIVDVLSDDVVV
jgi:bacteriocin-like protein